MLSTISASNAIHKHQKQLRCDDTDEASLRESADAMQTQSLTLRHAQTKIRLLAPAKTVDLANAVQLRVKNATTETRPAMSTAQHPENRATIAEARARLVARGKRDMALPR